MGGRSFSHGQLTNFFGWSGVRVAEGAALEMRCAGNRTEGSNPSRSDG